MLLLFSTRLPLVFPLRLLWSTATFRMSIITGNHRQKGYTYHNYLRGEIVVSNTIRQPQLAGEAADIVETWSSSIGGRGCGRW